VVQVWAGPGSAATAAQLTSGGSGREPGRHLALVDSSTAAQTVDGNDQAVQAWPPAAARSAQPRAAPDQPPRRICLLPNATRPRGCHPPWPLTSRAADQDMPRSSRSSRPRTRMRRSGWSRNTSRSRTSGSCRATWTRSPGWRAWRIPAAPPLPA